jgi:hypothetical protein
MVPFFIASTLGLDVSAKLVVALYVSETAILAAHKSTHELHGIKLMLRAQAHDSRHLAQIQSSLIEQLAANQLKGVNVAEGIQTLESCNKLMKLSLSNGLLVAEGLTPSLSPRSAWQLKTMCADVVSCIQAVRLHPGIDRPRYLAKAKA